MMLKDMTPGQKVFNMILGKSREIAPRRMKWLGQSGNNAQVLLGS